MDERDIELVMQQADVSRELAIDALKKHNNDIVNAIMYLSKDESTEDKNDASFIISAVSFLTSLKDENGEDLFKMYHMPIRCPKCKSTSESRVGCKHCGRGLPTWEDKEVSDMDELDKLKVLRDSDSYSARQAMGFVDKDGNEIIYKERLND